MGDGAIIRRYRITRTDNGATRTVTTTGGLTTSYIWRELSPNRTYSFTVRAVNQAGTSGATRSRSVRPLTDKPSVVIKSPARGATVQGVVAVKIEASRNAGTRAPISFVEMTVDHAPVTSDQTAPWGPLQWDTRRLTNGRHTIRVTVHDWAGRSATAIRAVTVSNPARKVTITSPQSGATVDGSADVTYTLTPANWDWSSSADLLIDGSFWTSSPVGQALEFNTSRLQPGAHTLRVRANSFIDGAHSSPAITIHVPTPTVRITSPTAGAELSGQVDVGYSLTPADGEWTWVELHVDDIFAAGTSPGGRTVD
jgi:predicted phage tail protein